MKYNKYFKFSINIKKIFFSSQIILNFNILLYQIKIEIKFYNFKKKLIYKKIM